MKVLFVFFNHPPTPFNSSVAALAAVARDAGHERSALSIPLTSTVRDAAARVDEVGADVVALTAMTRDWPAARAMLEQLRPGPLRLVGGYHATLASRDVAACDAVDAICMGDGERPLRALLEGGDLGSIEGLWTRDASGVFSGDPPPSDPEPDIAALPSYDYEVFGGIEALLEHGVNTFGPVVDRYLPTRASRGCPYRCAYCSAPTWGKVAGFAQATRNVRPVDHLCDELAALRDAYAPDGFEFWDEHFPIDVGWLRELARTYAKRVGLPFKVEMHPSAATRERLELLAEAGCALFHCGVEAGDAKLRRETLNRRTGDAVLERVFDDCRELGLETSASVMTALPGETFEQAQRTVELLRHLAPDSFMWSTYMALPFTPLGDRALERWPEPSRERLDDYRRPKTRLPSAMEDDERGQIHAALRALQLELVEAADGARERPVAVPTDRGARAPVSNARGDAPALASRLGFAPPSAALSHTFRLIRASREAGELVLEIESADVPAHVITVGPNDGRPAFRENAALRFAHRGADADPAVLRELERLARELRELP